MSRHTCTPTIQFPSTRGQPSVPSSTHFCLLPANAYCSILAVFVHGTLCNSVLSCCVDSSAAWRPAGNSECNFRENCRYQGMRLACGETNDRGKKIFNLASDADKLKIFRAAILRSTREVRDTRYELNANISAP